MDDPVKFTLWRELFVNWITFCDPKYGDPIRDVEALDIVEPLGTLEPQERELGVKLYSILTSDLRGPALQVVRSCSNDRNEFEAWHKLKNLYAPRALTQLHDASQHVTSLLGIHSPNQQVEGP